MRIRNPLYLNRPWLFPVFTAIGAAIVFRPGIHIPLMIKIVASATGFIGLNVIFFIALRRTRQDRNPPQA